MRKLLIAFTAVLSLALIPGLAGASHSPGTGPKFDKTNGTGVNAQAGEVHVNAKSVGGTTTAQGHFFAHDSPAFGGADVRGDVTCHRAGPPIGGPNSSTTGGVVRRSSNPALVGRGILIFIEDEVSGDDLTVFNQQNPPPASFCDFTFPFEANIVSGNYIVHDGA